MATEGYGRFAKLCEGILSGRQKDVATDLEEEFMKRAVLEFGSGRGSAGRELGDAEANTFDELDEE